MAPVGQSAPPAGAYQSQSFDTTGQVPPHGMKPRVTATLWEDEGSLCFQVEANGVCVARREDNHFINGTKLLNVAGMTRGRRDGILKSEKTRHVVKIGPMHLKGVWIPFDRALEFANKEKITEHLYPLFVHNIGALLYHPTNQARQQSIGNGAMAARRPESQDYMRTPTGTQPPALTHHHSMGTPVSTGMAQPPHTIAPHPTSGRPGLDRAHTFPTPPTSASGMTMGAGQYDYGNHANAVHPASSSPGSTSHMQYPSSQPYDSRQMYSAPANYSQYPSQHYNSVQPSPGVKSEMAPPTRAGAEHEHAHHKGADGYSGQQDADGEHEGDYTHQSASLGASNASYSAFPNAAPGPIHSEPSHISPEMQNSPQQTGSGRATPRTAAPYSGYSTPQRGSQLPSSNLYNVMSSDTRAGAPNGAEQYPQQGYAPQQYPAMNGVPQNKKRGREADGDDAYGNGLKRARTEGGPQALQRLTDSIATYNPNLTYADQLVTANDAVDRDLELLATHQSNYARIQSLRAQSTALDSSLRSTISQLAQTRKDILAIPPAPSPSSIDQSNELNVDTLLRYAALIAPTTVPPTLRKPIPSIQLPRVKLEGDGSVERVGGLSTPPPQPEGEQGNVKEGIVGIERVGELERGWLAGNGDVGFVPWVSDEAIRGGALAKLEGVSEGNREGKGMEVDQQEDGRVTDEARAEQEEQAGRRTRERARAEVRVFNPDDL
ncbi:Cell pattern formation-associated protein stuA [Cryoendolithus antarcticus]|uniref:Mediator of RNA polymerase II transcription subunit 4 n=1 Tax=Cryoendolithus antarcticus TaxID=1507870 RepID=A0A1V8SB41_9PEZI|nr:Cell pattern formation-associated protein stuA [Cryoendolithus antarcticus]